MSPNSGNNAKAYSTALNPKGAPDTTSGVFIYNTTDDTPSLPSNVNAAVTNAFYIVNSMHDLMVSTMALAAVGFGVTNPLR